tara:strand:+ start:751 stop:900 length:150 start_codon:yes stop_codon:yes gene_type:complete
MTKAIKLFLTKAVQWKLLKIYATIMTSALAVVWLIAMVNVVKEIVRTFF